jgi:hypothetical protein
MLILLLILSMSPLQQGKAVIQTGVAGAEVYLDGTLVDRTDGQGNLTMEDLPSGAFKLAIRKEGFVTHNGTFTIMEGETKTIAIKLEANPTRRQKSPPTRNTEVRQPVESARPAGEETPQNIVAVPPSSAEMSGQPALPPSDSAGRVSAVSENNEGSIALLLWIFGGVALLIGIGFGVSKVRKSPAAIEDSPEVSDESVSADPEKRPTSRTPEFIDELRRREELMQGGFIRVDERRPTHAEMKDKEVVIVLPKEAYRYEEDK